MKMKYKADMKRVFHRAACSLLAATVAFASCQDERLVKDAVSGSDVLAFEAVIGDSTMTRSEYASDASRMISFPGIEDSLSLAVSITDLSATMDTTSEETVTRGTPITTANLGEKYPTFVVYAKEVANSDDFTFSMNGVDVSYDAAQTPKWNTATPYYWPQMEAHDVDFWCYSPKTLSGYEGVRSTPAVDFTAGHITFDYQTTYGQTDSDQQVDAVKQPDLLFAHQAWNKDQGPVKVHFYHALSAIRFVAGVVENCQIKCITLTDVVTNASCVYAPASSSADMFQWTLSSNAGDKHDMSQTINVTLTPNEDESVKQDVTDADGHVERTFMVIPQDFQAIKVRVDYCVNGLHDYTKELTLPEFPVTQSSRPTEWIPGKMYTYVINHVGGDELYIEVEDEVEGLVKNNLRITNTSDSNVKCYIRAALMGNWYKDGKIVAPWNTSNGTFDSTFPTTVGTTVNNWTLASDGYYYYKYPVYPGKVTGQTDTDTDGDPLFQQYTAPSQSAVTGAQLKVQVVAQGVQWDAAMANVKEAWGTVIASYLSATDKE